MKQSILLLATITGVLTLAACSDNSSNGQADAPPASTQSNAPVSEKAEKLADDAKDLGSSVWQATKEKTGELVDTGKQALDNASNATAEAVESAKEKTAEVYQSAKEKTSEVIDSAKERMGSDSQQQPAPVVDPRKI